MMALFPLAALVSTAWSVYPAWTAYKSLELLVDIAVLAATIAAIRNMSELKSLFDWNWFMLALLQVSVWAGLLLSPESALLRLKGAVRVQLTGVVPNISANGVGHIGALLSVVALARMLDRNSSRGRTMVYGLVFAASFLTLFYAQTRSALIAFAAGAKSYQVTGPIIEMNDSMIVVTKGKERFEIDRDSSTKITGEAKVGAKATIMYTMSAKEVEVKADKGAKKEAKADAKPELKAAASPSASPKK